MIDDNQTNTTSNNNTTESSTNQSTINDTQGVNQYDLQSAPEEFYFTRLSRASTREVDDLDVGKDKIILDVDGWGELFPVLAGLAAPTSQFLEGESDTLNVQLAGLNLTIQFDDFDRDQYRSEDGLGEFILDVFEFV